MKTTPTTKILAIGTINPGGKADVLHHFCVGVGLAIVGAELAGAICGSAL